MFFVFLIQSKPGLCYLRALQAKTSFRQQRASERRHDGCIVTGACVFPAASGWKCQKCEMRENLWLNLTDGAVFCGKWFFDGSGGNGHALDHYKDTNHPLAVKLDTITPDGAGTAHLPELRAPCSFFCFLCTEWL